MAPLEKVRMLKSIASEYMETPDDHHFPADEVLDLLTNYEVDALQVILSDGSEQVRRYREKRGLV